MIISVNTKTPIQSMFYNILACKVGKCDFYDIWTIKEHVRVAAVSKGRCWKCRSSCQRRAVLEHAKVALGGKCCCWKCWSSCQGCAAVEHAVVAVVGKGSCWQSRSSSQRRAALEHTLIAAACKCSCRQCWSRCQGCTVFEHVTVTGNGKSRSRKFRSSCQRCAAQEHVLVAAVFSRYVQSRSICFHQGLDVSTCRYLLSFSSCKSVVVVAATIHVERDVVLISSSEVHLVADIGKCYRCIECIWLPIQCCPLSRTLGGIYDAC